MNCITIEFTLMVKFNSKFSSIEVKINVEKTIEIGNFVDRLKLMY